MADTNRFPISLRAWPQKEDKSGAIGSLIQRINTERGGFRNVTEESLAEEIKKDGPGLIIEDGGDNMETETSDEEDEPDHLKDLMTSKGEMLGRLEQAYHGSMLALDFVSLLISSHNPIQASQTISPGLRDAVGLGTLGADRLAEPRATLAQRDDASQVAQGWKLQSVIDTADSILASATKLEDDFATETRYWQEIMAVSTEGWSVCELPWETQTLGVRFGFRESSDSFVSRNIAALRRNADGTLKLDQGVHDSTLRRLRVRIQDDGVTVGQCYPPTTVGDDAPAQDLVLRARNAIFEDELWQELHREGRSLLNQGVRCSGSEIVYKISPTRKVVLDLLSGEEEGNSMEGTHPGKDSDMAHIVYITLHMLLGQAHRDKYRKRTQKQPPIGSGPTSNPAYALLRPVLAHLQFHSTIATLQGALLPLSQSLISAGLVDTTVSRDTPGTSSVSSNVLLSFINNLDATFSLPLIQGTDGLVSITIRMRTLLYPNVDTRFQIIPSKVLALIRPPPPSPNVREVLQYVSFAAACAIVSSLVDADSSQWNKTHNPTIMRQEPANITGPGKEIAFNINFTENTIPDGTTTRQPDKNVRVQLQLEYKSTTAGFQAGSGFRGQGTDSNSVVKDTQGNFVHDWSSSGEENQRAAESLHEVIRRIEGMD